MFWYVVSQIPGPKVVWACVPCLVVALAVSAWSQPRPVAAPGAAGATRDLVAGRQVKIEGRGRPDGTFDAVAVVLRNVDRTVKVEGRVTGVRGDKGGLTIMGFDVAYDRATTFYRGSRPGASRAEIAAGTWLEVKGARQGRTILAERVRIKARLNPRRNRSRHRTRGPGRHAHGARPSGARAVVGRDRRRTHRRRRGRERPAPRRRRTGPRAHALGSRVIIGGASRARG
jgi:hypothetical protein